MVETEKVKAALEKIRPVLQTYGGDVEFVDVTDGLVKVKLKDASAGCPICMMDLKLGIEIFLKQQVPEINGVETV